MDAKIAANKLLWDSRVEGHAASKFYDVPAFLAGACSLKAPELEALGDVSGKSLLHLQCHFGMDTLSWARRGAQVTGIDISDVAIAKAQSLATETGLPAQFVASSVADLPQHLQGQFDIVFTSYGALIWLPDLVEWAGIVKRYLKPGGVLCVAEFHPTWYGLDWESYQFAYPYFNLGEAFEETTSTSYAGNEGEAGMKEYFWCHAMSEILQPLLDQGLQLEFFKEYSYSAYNCFPNLQEVRPGEWIPTKMDEGKVAMMFAIRMRLPD